MRRRTPKGVLTSSNQSIVQAKVEAGSRRIERTKLQTGSLYSPATSAHPPSCRRSPSPKERQTRRGYSRHSCCARAGASGSERNGRPLKHWKVRNQRYVSCSQSLRRSRPSITTCVTTRSRYRLSPPIHPGACVLSHRAPQFDAPRGATHCLLPTSPVVERSSVVS
jgi:hypothetical protein